MTLKPIKLYWVYFLRQFQYQHGNGELEFRSFSNMQFLDKHYQELFKEIVSRQTITYVEWLALSNQRIEEVDNEIKRRGLG